MKTYKGKEITFLAPLVKTVKASTRTWRFGQETKAMST